MSKIKLIGVDLAKRCYQVCALSEDNQVLFNRQYSEKKFTEVMQQLEPVMVAMEACAAAHYWGRRMQSMGHTVRLIPPQHAEAFRRIHKSDQHDALSIAEAAQRPDIYDVPIKSIVQQDLQTLGGVRDQCVAQRTALINQARGFAREYGVQFPKSRIAFMARLPEALTDMDNSLSPVIRTVLSELYEEIKHITSRINTLLERMGTLASVDPAYERLKTIPGIGELLAPMILAKIGQAKQFASGKACAAWTGLVPRQHSTGGRTHLVGISKHGDRTLRTMIVHGARAVIRWAHKYHHAQSQWIKQLIDRRGKNKATVALANKMMRIIWVVLTQRTVFDMNKAYRSQPTLL